MPVSDKMGRAFEYIVTHEIVEALKREGCKVKLTTRAEEDQERGQELFQRLDEGTQREYIDSARKIASWMIGDQLPKYTKTPSTDGTTRKPASSEDTLLFIQVDRLPDQAGVKGDVTDIRINFFFRAGTNTLNISLKHGHSDTKHPRTTRVPYWIGLEGTGVAEDYTEKHDAVWDGFHDEVEKLDRGIKTFEEAKDLNAEIIRESLYEPLYELTKKIIEEHGTSKENVGKLYDFLIGDRDFIKVVSRKNDIEISDFSELPKPKSVTLSYSALGYIQFTFDNGLVLTGRLHNAEKELHTTTGKRRKTAKFAITPINLKDVIKPIVIKK